jgi:hypothetical protein
MPRIPIDYSKTIIYKLVHNEDYDNDNIYIGSTTDFIRRKSEYKNSCNSEKSKEYNKKKYQYIRENGGWGEWLMVEIEKHPCNDGNEARTREEYWKCHFKSQLNAIRAYRTEEQRIEQNKEYHKQHKDKRSEQNKEYCKQHKDKIKEQKSQQITCECGCIITKDGLIQHRKTQKHLLLTKQIKYEFVKDSDDN